MRISVIATADGANSDDIVNKSAVMFDILRASSTISTALANGCREVIPVEEVEDALAKAEKLEPGSYILGGERGSIKLPGFHHGNSPLEYSRETVKDKTVILTTTNGTKAIRRVAGDSNRVIIGSLLNAAAVAQTLAMEKKDVVLVCAGTRGKLSLEDTLAAGMVIKDLLKLGNNSNKGNAKALRTEPDKLLFSLEEEPINQGNPVLEDSAVAALRLAEFYQNNPLRALCDSLHGQKLAELGLERDLVYCAQVSIFDTVPLYINGKITVPRQ